MCNLLSFFPAAPSHIAMASFSFDVDYHTIVTDETVKQELENIIESKIATIMKVDESMILTLAISNGSIVVNFVLLAPVQSK